MVLNTEPLDWESSTLTTRPMLPNLGFSCANSLHKTQEHKKLTSLNYVHGYFSITCFTTSENNFLTLIRKRDYLRKCEDDYNHSFNSLISLILIVLECIVVLFFQLFLILLKTDLTVQKHEKTHGISCTI